MDGFCLTETGIRPKREPSACGKSLTVRVSIFAEAICAEAGHLRRIVWPSFTAVGVTVHCWARAPTGKIKNNAAAASLAGKAQRRNSTGKEGSSGLTRPRNDTLRGVEKVCEPCLISLKAKLGFERRIENVVLERSMTTFSRGRNDLAREIGKDRPRKSRRPREFRGRLCSVRRMFSAKVG